MRYLYLLFAFSLFACESDNMNDSSIDSETLKNVVVAKKCDPSQEKNFKGLIQNSVRLGGFEGGQPIQLDKLKAKGFQFSEVDGETNIIQHVFSPDLREIMIVRLSKKDFIIREITLITRDYITDKCIGVKSSIGEFIDAYSEYEIGYDAGNDSFYLSTPELMGIKFYILTTTFTGSMNDVSPRKKFKLEDFDSNTSIVNVGLSDF